MITNDIIFGVALLGVYLGAISILFNLWFYFNVEHRKLQVTALVHNSPGFLYNVDLEFYIRVSNDSNFRVDILECGLSHHYLFQEVPIYKLDFDDEYGEHSRTIEAHSYFDFPVDLEHNDISKLLGANYSYLILENGRKITGKNYGLANLYHKAKSKT